MAQQVGDLWPFSSGTSSLGAEMTNGDFTGTMRPFGHVHMNSGIFHPRMGQSGVIRYGLQGLEMSNDGGRTFIPMGSGINSLQTAYEHGHTISTSLAKRGPVAITGTDQSALRIAVTEGQGVHIELSGIISAPTLFSNRGGLLLARHNLNLDNPFLVTATDSSLEAISPGIPTLWLHAGQSGIVPLRIGSGIVQFFNTATSNTITETGLNVAFANTGQTNPDRFCRAITSSGIRFHVSGFYKLLYSASVKKTAGDLSQQCNAEIRVNDQWGRTFSIFGSSSSAIVRDSTGLNINTANGQTILDINAGEVVNVFLAASVAPIVPNIMVSPTRGVSLIIEYIGPQKADNTIRQEITP